MTAPGFQREDERPQNDRLGPTFVKEITTNHPNEPDLRSVHYIRAPHRRHLLTSSSSAYDQEQSMILFHSILQSLVEDCEFGQRVTAKERVTSRLIANREGETVHQ